MQLNGKLVKGIRNFRAFWVAIALCLVGAIFVGAGAYFFVTDQNKTYETASAIITDIQSEKIGEDENYYVIIKYTDKEGVEHTNVRLNAYNSSWHIGSEITIKYNTNDTSEVRKNESIAVLPIVFAGLGGLAIVVGVVTMVKTTKRARRKVKTQSGAGKQTHTNEPAHRVSDTELYFHLGGKMNQSYFVEDKRGNVEYECKLIKFNVLGAHKYNFIDYKNKYTKTLKIGKTSNSSSSGLELPFVGDILSSSFKIDGVNCWDYVADRGYEIKHLFRGNTIIKYELFKGGKKIANIIPANTKDPFNKNNVNFLRMAKGYYRLEIASGNLPDIVMIAFIISRTDIVE